MTTEIKNLQATAHNLLVRFDALKAGGECRGWGGEKWAAFCDKMEDFRAAVTAVKPCEHRNTFLVKDSETTGRVHCKDCGHSREWDAY